MYHLRIDIFPGKLFFFFYSGQLPNLTPCIDSFCRDLIVKHVSMCFLASFLLVCVIFEYWLTRSKKKKINQKLKNAQNCSYTAYLNIWSFTLYLFIPLKMFQYICKQFRHTIIGLKVIEVVFLRIRYRRVWKGTISIFNFN